VDSAEKRRWTREVLAETGIVLTDDEESRLEIADFGLGQLDRIGLQLLTYVNTSRVCAKEIVLQPRQICPEHRHPPVLTEDGKEETFRCRRGTVYLYVEGVAATAPRADLTEQERGNFSVWHEVVLTPGLQHTIMPNIKHWFQAGDEIAVVTEFSTRSTDENDIFTDPRIVRLP
jgi:D-lyxose ketol-isomerase